MKQTNSFFKRVGDVADGRIAELRPHKIAIKCVADDISFSRTGVLSETGCELAVVAIVLSSCIL